MTAEDTIDARLRATTAVTALVGSRIYPSRLPYVAPMPAITYQLISAVRMQGLRGPTGLADPRVQVNCWADTYTGAKVLAREVRRALDGFIAAGVAALIVGERDMPEPDSQREGVSQDYSVWVDE
jgi:hypothetical protein